VRLGGDCRRTPLSSASPLGPLDWVLVDLEERVLAHRVLHFLSEVQRRQLQQAHGMLQPRLSGSGAVDVRFGSGAPVMPWECSLGTKGSSACALPERPTRNRRRPKPRRNSCANASGASAQTVFHRCITPPRGARKPAPMQEEHVRGTPSQRAGTHAQTTCRRSAQDRIARRANCSIYRNKCADRVVSHGGHGVFMDPPRRPPRGTWIAEMSRCGPSAPAFDTESPHAHAQHEHEPQQDAGPRDAEGRPQEGEAGLQGFREARSADDAEACEAIVEQTCTDLEVHAQLEEQVFYPAARDAVKDLALLDEAEVEHMTAKVLIGQLQGMSAADTKFAATFKVLGEYIGHHVQEEEGRCSGSSAATRSTGTRCSSECRCGAPS
jgi:hypothetical protein